jgi:hypothetical protein
MRTSSFSLLVLASGVFAAVTGCDSARPVASESSDSSVTTTPTVEASDISFDREITQGNYRFSVKTYGSQEQRVASIRSYRGTAQTIDPLRLDITGSITNVMSGDLNGNGKPELYIFTDNKRANGGLYAYEFGERGYTPITAPGNPSGTAGTGYSGQDTYQISGNKLIRTFPVSSTTAAADGSTPAATSRSVEYTLDASGKLVMGQSMDAQR